MADYEMLDVCEVDGVTVIRFRAREVDETKLQCLTQELGKVTGSREDQRFVLDLEAVAFLTSTGIGALIALKKKIEAAAGILKLCGLQSEIRTLFTITQVDRLFDIEDNADVAVKSF